MCELASQVTIFTCGGHRMAFPKKILCGELLDYEAACAAWKPTQPRPKIPHECEVPKQKEVDTAHASRPCHPSCAMDGKYQSVFTLICPCYHHIDV